MYSTAISANKAFQKFSGKGGWGRVICQPCEKGNLSVRAAKGVLPPCRVLRYGAVYPSVYPERGDVCLGEQRAGAPAGPGYRRDLRGFLRDRDQYAPGRVLGAADSGGGPAPALFGILRLYRAGTESAAEPRGAGKRVLYVLVHPRRLSHLRDGDGSAEGLPSGICSSLSKAGGGFGYPAAGGRTALPSGECVAAKGRTDCLLKKQ